MPYGADEPAPEAGASFWDHLAELRRRLLFCVAALVVGFVGAWILKEELFALVSAPVKEGLAAHGIYRLTAIETVEAITVYLKLCVAAGIVFASPVVVYQLWAFVRPGLNPGEYRPIRRVAVLAAFMFMLGLIFSYRFVLPLVIDFLTGFTLGAGDVDFQVTMKSAYSTSLVFLVGFGAIFELPLVMVMLAATPLLDYRKYLRWIRYAIVVSFLVGSMLTPPDILSQMLMAVPVTILYCVGIGLSYLMEKRRERGVPVPSGPDWVLAGGALLLAALITALVYPTPSPMAAYLPYGARTIALARGEGAGGAGCGIFEGQWAGRMASAGEVACAVYPEGPLLLLDTDGADETDWCDAGGLAQGLTCRREGDLVVAGHPLLVARYVSNREQRKADADPIDLGRHTQLSLFVSLDSTRKQQRSFLRASILAEEEVEVRLNLAFADPKDARDFLEALAVEDEVRPVAPRRDPARRRTERVLTALCDAVETLAADVPAETAKAARASLREARRLLAPVESFAGPDPELLRICDNPYCAYAGLAPLLPARESEEASGRMVTLRYLMSDKPDELAALTAFLTAAAND